MSNDALPQEAVRMGHTSKSAGAIGLHDNILSAHWWDEVFEAADLLKFVTHINHSQEDLHTHCHTAEGRAISSASGMQTTPSFSSTSSTASDQRGPSGMQSAGTGDSSPIIYPSRLKILAAKIALNSGKEHVSPSGLVRKARYLKDSCHSKCKRCQPPRLTQAERLLILDHFWSLKSHEKQWTFISNAVSVFRPKRKFAVKGSKGGKSCSREYYLPVHGKKRKVCKTMFKHTLSICDSWIDSALSHALRKTPDLRGRFKRKLFTLC